MKVFFAALLSSALLFSGSSTLPGNVSAGSNTAIFGFRKAAAETAAETQFLSVPDSKLAEEHLRILTKAPHMAGTIEDKATADYVARKFREAGLDTEIVVYKVWMNYPAEISVDMTDPAGVEMHGPTREHVSKDPYQDDPRVVMPFSGMSPSGDVEAEVVYANYGTPEMAYEIVRLFKVSDVRSRQIFAMAGHEGGIVTFGENLEDAFDVLMRERRESSPCI